jgi:uncharacterized protein YacL
MLFRRVRKFMMDLDTVADPRIAEFLELGLVSGTFILPQPPQPQTEENDHRARRAWETIERLRKVDGIKVKLDPGLTRGAALVEAARKSKAVVITSSADLKKQCDGVPAVTTGQVYDLFKPVYLPGTELKVKVQKKGKEKSEGIGYLEGGVKVVIEDAARSVGTELDVVVKGALETGVGRVVFARPRFTDVR